MSYILDALRRAESQRALGKVPGLGTPLATLPSSSARDRRRGPSAAAWIAGVAAVTVVCVWIVWQFLWPATTAVPPPPPMTNAPTRAPTVVAPSPTVPPVDVQASIAPPRTTGGPRFGASTPARAASAVATTEAPSSAVPPAAPASVATPAATPPAPAASAAAARVVGVNDLPADIRQQLPALALSGSVYSETPSARLLVANGQLAREGDTVAPGVTLQQIQPRGAVVLFRGYRVLLPF